MAADAARRASKAKPRSQSKVIKQDRDPIGPLSPREARAFICSADAAVRLWAEIENLRRCVEYSDGLPGQPAFTFRML